MHTSIRATVYGGLAAVAVLFVVLGTPPEPVRQTPAEASASLPAAPPSLNASGGGITLRSVDVEFPDSSRGFPSGAAATVVIDNCTACHSPGMILNQPSLTAAQWAAEVNHMRGDFKAPVAESDVAAIVAYLAATKGTK